MGLKSAHRGKQTVTGSRLGAQVSGIGRPRQRIHRELRWLNRRCGQISSKVASMRCGRSKVAGEPQRRFFDMQTGHARHCWPWSACNNCIVVNSPRARQLGGLRSPRSGISKAKAYGRLVVVYQWLNNGLPNSEGARSSRKKSNCALPPISCPDALLSGTIASTATCQVTAT